MVYKIRIILDTKEDIFRDVEIKGKQTLWNLHNGIKSAFSLRGDDLSTFNLLEADGTIIKAVPLEDMSDDGDGEIMSDIYISEAFDNNGKAQFQYGFLDLWEFFCELVETKDEKNGVNYPITVFRFGNVPLKAPGKTGTAAAKKAFIPSLEDDYGLDEYSGSFDEEDDDFNDGEDEDDFSDDFPDDEI